MVDFLAFILFRFFLSLLIVCQEGFCLFCRGSKNARKIGLLKWGWCTYSRPPTSAAGCVCALFRPFACSSTTSIGGGLIWSGTPKRWGVNIAFGNIHAICFLYCVLEAMGGSGTPQAGFGLDFNEYNTLKRSLFRKLVVGLGYNMHQFFVMHCTPKVFLRAFQTTQKVVVMASLYNVGSVAKTKINKTNKLRKLVKITKI